ARFPGPCGRAPFPVNRGPKTFAASANSRRYTEAEQGRRSSCRMDKLQEALARLERAVARLEAAASAERPAPVSPGPRPLDNPELRAIAGEIATRVDGALARIGRILGGAG